jgi:hypothetical protein
VGGVKKFVGVVAIGAVIGSLRVEAYNSINRTFDINISVRVQ